MKKLILALLLLPTLAFALQPSVWKLAATGKHGERIEVDVANVHLVTYDVREGFIRYTAKGSAPALPEPYQVNCKTDEFRTEESTDWFLIIPATFGGQAAIVLCNAKAR